MPRKIISDAFEQLEQLGKTTAKQAGGQVKKAAQEAASVVTGQKGEQGIGEAERNPKGFVGQPKLTQAQIAQKIEKASQMRAKLHLQEIEEQISEIQKQRLEQVKRIQEAAFKKEEQEKGPQEAQLPSKRKRGFSPIGVVKRLKQKVEGFRGVSGQ